MRGSQRSGAMNVGGFEEEVVSFGAIVCAREFISDMLVVLGFLGDQLN